MTLLDIQPVKNRVPFSRGDDCFYCNLCDSYTPNFSPSYIKNRDRRCRDCVAKKRFQKMQTISHLQRLKTKLYQNLMYQNKKNFARAVTTETVSKLLEQYNIKENEISLVKTIKPIYHPIHKTWTAHPVFYNVSRIAKELDE